MGRATFSLAFGLMFIAADLAATQRPIPVTAARQTWLTAVDGHSPGVLDAATKAVAEWSLRDLEAVLADWLRSPADGRDRTRTLRRAAMLHADIAILHRSESGYGLPPSDRAVLVAHDGVRTGTGSGTVHWDFARTLIDGVPETARDEYVRLWYRATSAILQDWRDDSELSPNLSRALQLFPDDAVLLLYRGTLREKNASPAIQSVLGPSPNSAPQVAQVGALIGPAWSELAQAETALRLALKSQPSLHEARIRLGNVLGLRGRHDDAVVELRAATAELIPAQFRYCGLLFLGREQHARGKLAEARAAFSQAAALYPGAQSPRLWLSLMARDAGDRETAITQLGVLGRPLNATQITDPLWLYSHTHVPDSNSWLAELRKAFR